MNFKLVNSGPKNSFTITQKNPIKPNSITGPCRTTSGPDSPLPTAGQKNANPLWLDRQHQGTHNNSKSQLTPKNIQWKPQKYIPNATCALNGLQNLQRRQTNVESCHSQDGPTQY